MKNTYRILLCLMISLTILFTYAAQLYIKDMILISKAQAPVSAYSTASGQRHDILPFAETRATASVHTPLSDNHAVREGFFISVLLLLVLLTFQLHIYKNKKPV